MENVDTDLHEITVIDTDNKHGITNIDLEKVEIALHELTDRYNRGTENHGIEDIEMDSRGIHS